MRVAIQIQGELSDLAGHDMVQRVEQVEPDAHCQDEVALECEGRVWTMRLASQKKEFSSHRLTMSASPMLTASPLDEPTGDEHYARRVTS